MDGKAGDDLQDPLTVEPDERKSCWCCCSFKNMKVLFWTIAQDWIFLAMLGCIMSLLSFGMDYSVSQIQNGQMKLYDLVKPNVPLSLLVWIGYVVLLIFLSALCAHYIAPQAIGSGIPEMKTILRGVILKEYLTIRTAVTKMVALTLSLGSGLPMGKEGPFVHISSALASQLSRLVHGTRGVYENESRNDELLSAGCAVGVACTFSAPVGGVLFSIEVTSVYFAVRNYWRGFFAAICAATLFRILRVFAPLDSEEVNMAAHFQTKFPFQNAYLPQEFPFFAAIGIVCGVLGALFVFFHRKTVLFLRRNAIAKKIFQKYWVIYPLLVSVIIPAFSYPLGLGRYMGGEQRFSSFMKDFFANCTWTLPDSNQATCLNNARPVNWEGDHGQYNIFVNLTIFQVFYFFASIIVATLPIPSGAFIPAFVLGAAFGRQVGEGLALWFPDGMTDDPLTFIRPGAYAVVGAAAMCASLTHTVSIAVIVFELTGQLCLLLPVMIAVLISNAVASFLQPSIYDSIIRMKNLPYLPDIPHTASLYHKVLVEQIMIRPVLYVTRTTTVGELKNILEANTRIKAFPLVDSKDSQSLIGSISRSQLLRIVDGKVGDKARLAEAARRVKVSLEENVGGKLVGHDNEAHEELAVDDSEDDKSCGREKRKRAAKDGDKSHKNGKPKSDSVSIKFLVNEEDERGVVKVSELNLEHLDAPKTNRFLVVPVVGGEVDAKKPTGRERGHQNENVDNADGILPPNILAANKKLLTESKSFDVNKSVPKGGADSSYQTFQGIFRSITKFNFGRNRRFHNDFDLYDDERSKWEKQVLDEVIDISTINVDSTPFQLAAFTSLFKAHSLFSLLGLNRTYVTKEGKLIGVVALRELRVAIERVQAGDVPPEGLNIFDGALQAMENGTLRRTAGVDEKRKSIGDKRVSLAPTYEADAVDADDDYIQPPFEVISRESTPDSAIFEQAGRLQKDEVYKTTVTVAEPESRIQRRRSTCDTNLSELEFDDDHSTDSESGLHIDVPHEPTPTDSLGDAQETSERQRKMSKHVKIISPQRSLDNDEGEE